MYYITINVQYVRYSTGRKIKYFIVYRLSFTYVSYNLNAIQIEWPFSEGKESRMKASRLELSVNGSVCVSADGSCGFVGIEVSPCMIGQKNS
jgi:hypothetical protein